MRRNAIDSEAMSRNVEDALGTLKSLANRRRLMIMCLLAEGESSVTALSERIGVSRSVLSQHLAILRQQGLVTTRRDAQTVYYSLVDSPALEIVELLHDRLCRR